MRNKGRNLSVLELPELRDKLKKVEAPKPKVKEKTAVNPIIAMDNLPKPKEMKENFKPTPAIDHLLDSPTPYYKNGRVDTDRMISYLTEKVKKDMMLTDFELKWLQDLGASIVGNKIAWRL